MNSVVGAADVSDEALRVARGDVAGAEVLAFDRLQRAVVVEIAGRQSERLGRERQGDLAVVGFEPLDVEQHDAIARQRPPHRADHQLLPRRIADHHRRLGLAVAIAQRQSPGAPHLLDHVRTERLARRANLAQRHVPLAEIELNELAPDGRRGAERSDRMGGEIVEDGARFEAPRQRDGGRAGVPWREDIRPRVLGPAGRRNVEMHVVGLQAEPVHGRQMADRIARMRVQHQLRLRRGAGGEIEQQRVARPRRRVRLEMRARPHELGPVAPARRRAADGDARQQAVAAPLELRRGGRLGDDEAHAAARQPFVDVGVGRAAAAPG